LKTDKIINVSLEKYLALGSDASINRADSGIYKKGKYVR
jgi:hypothetical protein